MSQNCSCSVECEAASGKPIMLPYHKILRCPLHQAAPELLKAVKQMAQDFHHACGTNDIEKCQHGLCLENSRLLANAEGRT